MRQLDLVHDTLRLRFSFRCYRSLASLRQVLRKLVPEKYSSTTRGLTHTRQDGSSLVFYTDALPHDSWKGYLLHECVHVADHSQRAHHRDRDLLSEYRAYLVSGLYMTVLDWHASGCPATFSPSTTEWMDAMDHSIAFLEPGGPE